MGKQRGYAGYLVVIILSLCLASGMSDSAVAQAKEALVLSGGSKITMTVGEKNYVSIKGLKKKGTWKSSAKKIVSVKRLKSNPKMAAVKGKKAGKATITVKSGKKRISFKVIVKKKNSATGGTDNHSFDANEENSGENGGTQSSNSSTGDNGQNGSSTAGGSTTGGSQSGENTEGSGDSQVTSGDSGQTEPSGGVSLEPKTEFDASTVDRTDYKKYFSLYAVHKSTATYYDNGYTNTCCNLDDIAGAYDVAAINEYDYNGGVMAGAYLEVTGPKGKVNVLVTDLMPFAGNESNCTVGALDLNENTFAKIANKVDGKVNISWKVIAFPTSEPVQYKFKPTSTQWWCEVQVRNFRYPIVKCEVKKSDGTYTALPRKEYNYFAAESGLGEGPYTFRVTDIYGQVLEDTVPLSTDKIVNGKANFPVVQ